MNNPTLAQGCHSTRRTLLAETGALECFASMPVGSNPLADRIDRARPHAFLGAIALGLPIGTVAAASNSRMGASSVLRRQRGLLGLSATNGSL